MSHAAQFAARLTGVSHRYGKTLAVDALDLEIPAGCMAGFIGPDGVGKSSVLALIAGATKIQTGRVEVFDGDMAENAHRFRACPRIAYMPQGLGRNLYPTLSVFENVDFFGRLFGHSRRERHARIEELLTATDLVKFADRPACKLSGGMKQKLSLCCALIHDPDLLILDEPTTGVDPLSRRHFWALVDRLRQQRPQMSVIVATAYMEEAERFDWLVAMNAGRALTTGSPAELKSRTQTATLEDAFIALLPAEQRGAHTKLVIPPRDTRGDSEEDIVIEARDLTCRFGDFTAVDNVNFRIRAGEIFGFLGSNGCGKTTTMKMLTGLLPATSGTALLFGRQVNAKDMATRTRVGYMSQSFSLYTELTVRQNLELHADLFHMPMERKPARVEEMLQRFGLTPYVDQRPEGLPLGIRQRLSLAVAVIHEPDMLILDEPTSGVDPVARDSFWELLIDLARRDGVTIFITTHFMNEAERCDRISLMYAGKVLAQGTPQEICTELETATLEDAFIKYLEVATGEYLAPSQATAAGHAPAAAAVAAPVAATPALSEPATPAHARPSTGSAWFSLRRLWAYSVRETMEILRDPIRLMYSLFGPLVMLIVFGYGISFDVENLTFAVLDRDHSVESREYLENFKTSRYFSEQPELADHEDLEMRMRRGQIKVAIEIPPGYGEDLARGRQPEIGIWIDGSKPTQAETSLGYIEGAHQNFLDRFYREHPGLAPPKLPASVETRFRYNPDFRSVNAIVPSSLMLLLIFIPAMMTAVGVVREIEMGSITNLYVTPVTGVEFLLGKQLPYVVISLISFFSMFTLAQLLFEVPLKGSFIALVIGAALYSITTTGFGLLLSTMVRTQVAAIFATGILSIMPAIQFSGMFTPVASLTGFAQTIGKVFPSSFFEHISIGSFTKGLGFMDLSHDMLVLIFTACVFLFCSRMLLRTQAR